MLEKCTITGQKIKKYILGRGHCTSPDPCPIGKGTPPPKPHSLGACGASTLGPSALDMCPLSKILDPPLASRYFPASSSLIH